MSLFQTDWNLQVVKILAPVLRVYALTIPLTDYLKGIIGGQLNYNGGLPNVWGLWQGQKIVLQAALNSFFGLSANTIYIGTQRSFVGNNYIYNKVENNPVYFFNKSEGKPLYIFNKAEIVTPFYPYTVFIPVGIYTAELNRRVIAFVKLYGLAGKLFNTATY